MSAFVILKRFRVSFGRVPRRDGPGMSPDSTLFLEVDEIQLKGAFGEAMWDTPIDVFSDRNIKEWISGLRQDGGAGNVLKLRKQQRDAMFAERAELAEGVRTIAPNDAPVQTTIDTMDVKVRVARRSSGRHPIAPSTANPSRRVVDKEALRRASWKRFYSKVMRYFGPPDDVLDHLFMLCGESAPQRTDPQTKIKPTMNDHSVAAQTPSPLRPKVSSPVRRRGNSPTRTAQSSPPRSPSNWSPSVRGSPRAANSTESSETEEEPEEEPEDGSASGSDREEPHERAVQKTSSTKLGSESPVTKKVVHRFDDRSPSMSVPPPPLAQRPRRPLSSSLLQAPLDPSMDVLPPSSLQPPASSWRTLPSSKSPLHKQEPSIPAWNSATIRRVPHPQVASLRPDPDTSGEGRVLVENSSQSQSQSQSQDHIHSDQRESIQQDVQSPKLQNVADDNRSAHAGDDNGEEVSVAPAESQEDSQVSAKSRQSLSYKGDSQSQEQASGVSPLREQGLVSMAAGSKTQPAEPVADVSIQPEDGVADAEPEDEPQVAVEVAAPTWAAIRTEASPEGDQDSNTDEVDVDELLSDPIDKKGKKGVLPKRTRGRMGEKDQITAAKGKDRERLESDDERTATLVSNYVSHYPIVARDWHNEAEAGDSEIPVARAVSPMKRPRLSTPPVAGQSQGRPLKRRKQAGDSERTRPSLPAEADVFTSDDSFHGEPNQLPSSSANPKQPQALGAKSVSGARKLAHDPTVWATPTFLQKPTEMRQTVRPPVAVAKKPSREAMPTKRPIDAVASPEDQEAPTKKRKILAVSRHSATSSHQAQQQADRASTSSKSSKPSWKPDTTNGHPESVALRASRASSRSSSSNASRSETRGSRSDRAALLRANTATSDAKGNGKAPMRTSESSERSSGSKGSGFGLASGAARGSAQQHNINRFVDDYKAALHPTKTPDGPPIVGWQDVMNILLETGRARREERERQSDGRGSSRR
ncbi:hypothetical protein C8Q80DRAFT_884111 [Daedaleopsis nitida]|nr:hypothetical protein C8Q80DRAFT_884111 [Daedaleopsis nitida]